LGTRKAGSNAIDAFTCVSFNIQYFKALPCNTLHFTVDTVVTLNHFAVAQLFILLRQNEPLPQMQLSCSAVILYGSDSYFFGTNENFATAK
jgi:hypothetical protein